jgi:hypothetical protein
MRIDGQGWTYTEEQEGVYLHLEKDGHSIAISIGHPDDTLQAFNEDLRAFFTRVEQARALSALKQQISDLVQKPAAEWSEADRADVEAWTFELHGLGWQVIYPGEGRVLFEPIEVASRGEAVRLGYVEE